MNIWVVNPFDGLPGESLRPGRYAFLTKMLAEKGHRVTWWSSNFCHTTKNFRNQGQASLELNHNLRIILLETPRYTKNISLRRIWNHYLYARELEAQSGKIGEPPDVVLASTPPLQAANTAMILARKYGAKSIIDVQDVWPEAFEVAFPTRLRPVARLFLCPLRRFADRLYDEADGITAVSHSYLHRALSASKDEGKPSVALPLGVNLDLYSDYLSKPVDNMPYIKQRKDEFWVLYAGTIGKMYDIRTLLEAAGRLFRSYPDMKFVIAGAGPDYANMRNYSQKMNLINVTFTGLLSYHQFVHLLNECDVGVNPIVLTSHPCLPNKVFDYLAAGLPIINSVRGELEHLITDERVGLHYDPGDAQSLADAIAHLYDDTQERLAMGQRARKLAQERFDMNKEYPKFEEFIRAMVS